METAILIVWWATLLVALILTVVILKLVVLIVRTERDILKLAHLTLPAAQGIDKNTALIAELETTKTVAGKILNAAVRIKDASASIENKLRALGRGLAEKRL